MTKCPVCQKDKSEYEMRPLFNVKEIKVSSELSGEKNEREIGGAKLDMVCRSCWEEVLKGKTKEEIMEMFETLCGLLLELDRKRSGDLNDWIEKMRTPAPPPSQIPLVFPSLPQINPWVGTPQPGITWITSTAGTALMTDGNSVNSGMAANWLFRVLGIDTTEGDSYTDVVK